MAIDIYGDENLCVAVYDPNEPDVTKKLITVYENPWQACKKLGLSASNVRRSCISKKRRFSPTLDKDIALRYKAKIIETT